jgi:uncharacterized protein (DUF58 family)
MTTEELMREVRRLEITTRRAVTEVFAGEYSSALKGRGIEFAEVREYQPGDDVRSIDWNVTARTGHPFIKRFTEERELTVVLAVDLSRSSFFGSAGRTKAQLAAEVCAVLAFAASRKNDRVGLVIFTDRVELYLPPKKGQRHTLRLIRELLAFEPTHRGTSVRAALEHLAHVLKRRAVVFLLSDFIDTDFEHAARLVAQRHELIAVEIGDPREGELPVTGLVEVEDTETGRRLVIDTASRRVRDAYHPAGARRPGPRRVTALHDRLDRLGIDRISLSTASPYVHELAMFFRRRERRR